MRWASGLTERITVGVVGAGNMGSALIRGWLRDQSSGVELLAWDKVESCLRALPGSERISVARSLEDLAAKADVVVLVVKPKDAADVLGAIAGRLEAGQTLISAMAGVPLDSIRSLLGPGPGLFRIMPNLGVELGAGAVALASEGSADGADIQAVLGLLGSLGRVEAVPEDLMDVVTAVSGSGPAFIALAMEGLEDGAVAVGRSRREARSLVREAALAVGALAAHPDPSVGVEEACAAATDAERMVAESMRRRGVPMAFREAVEAALERSRRLRAPDPAK